MKIPLKILKWTAISVGSLLGCLVVAYLIYDNIFYERELNQIKNDLNAIENVEVIDIWGHKDITLEEISARLRVKGKGEIVLYGLSKDAFNYPNRVPVIEIGNYSFTWFSCNGGIGPIIDIGIKDELGYLFKREFKSVKDVIENYDLILETVETLKMSPELNHIETDNSESYLLIENKKTKDQDPFFNLVGIENKFEFARTLTWNRPDCYNNKEMEKRLPIE
jgi:hypothetical protein